MIKLTLTLDGIKLNEYVLDKQRVTVGRTPQNDIQLENLGISSSHAAIVREDNSWTVEDLSSKNGTTVNGQRVSRQTLKHGDVIGIVKYQLHFSDATEADLDDDSGRATMRIEPNKAY